MTVINNETKNRPSEHMTGFICSLGRSFGKVAVPPSFQTPGVGPLEFLFDRLGSGLRRSWWLVATTISVLGIILADREELVNRTCLTPRQKWYGAGRGLRSRWW
jgi:hypothetical protein